jgi:hypothetical protein
MYCGNNRLDQRVIDGKLVIGNRYQCLRQGINKGLSLPPYSGSYDPIFKEKVYCGKKNVLPAGYDRFGSNSQCFQKGIGVGKRINSNTGNIEYFPEYLMENNSYELMAILIVLSILSSISFGYKETTKFVFLGPFSSIL